MDLLEGIYETHIQVSDLEASMEFYGETLDLELGTLSEERRSAFYFVTHGDGERSMLGLWETEDVFTNHFAFRVDEEHVDVMKPFLTDRGIEVVEQFGVPPENQPLVHAWMPAAAIYFEDPDGNLLELIADLPGDPLPDRGAMPLSEWRDLAD